jgi:hypothetical protein
MVILDMWFIIYKPGKAKHEKGENDSTPWETNFTWQPCQSTFGQHFLIRNILQ